MYVIRKPNYTVRVMKDGRIETKYKNRTLKDKVINVIVVVGGVAILAFWFSQVAQIMLHIAK